MCPRERIKLTREPSRDALKPDRGVGRTNPWMFRSREMTGADSDETELGRGAIDDEVCRLEKLQTVGGTRRACEERPD
jgi:hypothetical protein